MIPPFQIAPIPAQHFGWGIRHQFCEQLITQKHTHLVIISSQFLARPGQFSAELVQKLQDNGTRVQLFTVSGEPSPELIDSLVTSCSQQTETVIGIGGGSVLDTAKSVAGLIPSQTSVMDYLEGVGKGLTLEGDTLPFIALPTTAGTGSETTKNAVLSRLGEFKKSFRSDKLLAKAIWLDPEFLITCPKDILYTTGLDAFTQLLESYTTLKSNPITDALAWQGMVLFKDAFKTIDSKDTANPQQGYANLMLAASLSGTTLANAGLGAVHGLAGPIGAFFDIPHGAVCANLLAPITQQNIQSLQKLANTSEENRLFAQPYLNKYTQIAHLFCDDTQHPPLEALPIFLNKLAQDYVPKTLTDYGLTPQNSAPILKNCRSGSMLGNPITLTDTQLQQALHNTP